MEDNCFDYEYEEKRQEYEQKKEEERLAKLPVILFKYKAMDTDDRIKNVLDILQTHEIYMPNYEKLNDPLEGTNAKLLDVDQSVRDEIRKRWQILALSADCFLPTLWAYYADNYQGICIGFKTHDTFNNVKDVKYVLSHQSWTTDPDAFFEDELEYKHECWSYEKEWRIIRKAVFNEKGEVENNFLQFEEDDIQHVFVGYKMKNELIEQIASVLPPKAQLWKVLPSTDSFRLCAVNMKDNRTIYSVEDLC